MYTIISNISPIGPIFLKNMKFHGLLRLPQPPCDHQPVWFT